MQVKLDKELEELIMEISQETRRSPTQEVNYALWCHYTKNDLSEKPDKNQRVPRKQK